MTVGTNTISTNPLSFVRAAKPIRMPKTTARPRLRGFPIAQAASHTVTAQIAVTIKSFEKEVEMKRNIGLNAMNAVASSATVDEAKSRTIPYSARSVTSPNKSERKRPDWSVA